MSNSGSYNADGTSKSSMFSRYKSAILILAFVILSLLITFFLVRGLPGQESEGPEDAPSTSIITPAPSVTLASPTLPISPISPVSPGPTSPESTTFDPYAIPSVAEMGLQLYESGDHEGALEAFNTVIDVEPSPLAYDVRGSVYTALNDYQSALDDYARAIELDPSFAQAYYNRGRVYSFLKRYDQALPDLKQSAELDPSNFGYRANGNIGLIHHQLGDYDKALEAFEASMSYDDTKADVYYLRGETYTALEDYQDAIVNYEAAIERFSDYDLAYQSLGYAYYKTAQYGKATEALDRALEVSPDSPIARFYLALVNLAEEDVESAHAEISHAVDAFSRLSREEQALVYTRVVGELEVFAQESPDSAAAVEALIEGLPEPQ